jgi:hypothetical protein
MNIFGTLPYIQYLCGMTKPQNIDRQFLTKRYVAEYFFPCYPHRTGWRKLKTLFGDNPETYNLFHSRRSHVRISEFTYMRTSF